MESEHVKFLNDILPYLVLKTKQAKLIIDFWKTKIDFHGKRMHGRWARLDENEISKREYYHLEIKKLNRRGRPQRLSEEKP